jgi:TolA-binding protein
VAASLLLVPAERLHGDECPPVDARPRLQQAHDLFVHGQYARAEAVFRHIAQAGQRSQEFAEEARYYQAEALRHQNCFPRAAQVYHELLRDFPGGAFREQANRRLFQIADYWLNDTREAMQLRAERMQGRRLLCWPPLRVHWSKEWPVVNAEGAALDLLAEVYRNEPDGPLATKALFYSGNVWFFRKDYARADAQFAEIIRKHANDALCPGAIEVSILCKMLSIPENGTNGEGFAEMRRLIDLFRERYPVEAAAKADSLHRMLFFITTTEGASDFQAAERLEKAGDLRLACAGYEKVCRRNPESRFAEQARERLQQLRGKPQPAPRAATPNGTP